MALRGCVYGVLWGSVIEVPLVGGGHAGVIPALGVGWTVIASGKSGPVLGAEVFEKSGVGDERGEHIELVAFSAPHFFQLNPPI